MLTWSHSYSVCALNKSATLCGKLFGGGGWGGEREREREREREALSNNSLSENVEQI